MSTSDGPVNRDISISSLIFRNFDPLALHFDGFLVRSGIVRMIYLPQPGVALDMDGSVVSRSVGTATFDGQWMKNDRT